MNRLIAWTLNFAYLLVLLLCAPMIAWVAVRKGKYREGWGAKLLGQVPRRTGEGPCVWVHAVSVGEVNLLATTLRELASRRPDLLVVISTTTKTGYDLALRKYGNEHTVFYCPLDFTWAVRRAVERVRPDLLVLAELELWPNLIAAAKRHGAGVAIINGRLSDNSYRGYRRLRWLVGRVLSQIDVIAAQDQTTADRFTQLATNPQTILSTGSLKYDGAATNRDNPRTKSLSQLAGFTDEHLVFLAGSTQAPEEAMAIRLFGKLHSQYPQLRVVLVPRHPERFDEVAELLAESPYAWQRRSTLEEGTLADGDNSILLVDTIGELGGWWGRADIGFVGGSFGDRGGQNMIEPAAYGVATSFGPNTWNFRDIVAALLHADGAEVVADEAALQAFVERCLADPAYRTELGDRARQFIATQLGATARTVELLLTLLPAAPQTTHAAA
ncbi:3-deoxy-D-manno-octulosonic acid transferase [Aeoliella mucimassa]|uniref:3-deoxy-D-manno-octulosonic acid transferase n=1 Tax=Aeoliella mucimassa TaxID=2527972 RepID=A0A518ALM1_9BACT|nr:3-deoxy-D-manno-octulosonic acid transferase [Aeoliella mucimassa]QDU55627.1 3-deoxy-D-manno-octulosonic acid transferase [Aeoliella mucimassa]